MKISFLKTVALFFLSQFFVLSCTEGEKVNLSGQAPPVEGLNVAEEEYCQRLEIVGPEEVRKSDLPVFLQGFRDHCQSLIRVRPEEFLSSNPVFSCRLNWDQNTDTENFDISRYLDNVIQPGFADTFRSQGDFEISRASQRLLFAADPSNTAQFYWKKSQLWNALVPEVPDLESLSWRLSFQHTNSVVCSPFAKWEVLNTVSILHNVEKCYPEGKVFKDTYTFDLSGRLLDLDQQTVDEPKITCN